jgi:hypothetical protein
MPSDLGSRLTAAYIASERPSIILDYIIAGTLDQRLTATVHPYGFFVILLARSAEEEWRFHIWPPNRDIGDGMPAPIHTHEKTVTSRILRGALTNITYSVEFASDGALPVYEVRHLADKYGSDNKNILIKRAERGTAHQESAETYDVGDTYTVPPHVFREALTPTSLASCTIVQMHSGVPGVVKILGTDGYEDRLEFTRRSCLAAEAMRLSRL